MENHKILIAFDLDDTLYKEVEFVKSAYRHISIHLNGKYKIDYTDSYNTLLNAFNQGKNPFDTLLAKYPAITESTIDLVEIYRFHPPTIILANETRELLEKLKAQGYTLAIITDGRSRTQHNKIESLGINKYAKNENIIISEEFGSEKTDIRNFLYFNDNYQTKYYIGDNPRKDFLNPNALNWHSVMLRDNGENIHSQKIALSSNHFAKNEINTISELYKIID